MSVYSSRFNRAYTRKAKRTSATARIAVNHNVRRKRSDTLSCLPEHVAGSTHRLNQPRLAALLDLVAQVANVDFEDVSVTAKVVSPNVLEDHVTSKNLTRMTEKERKQLIFFSGELDGSSPAR